MQFGQLVAENFLSFDQHFWMRVAARCDSAGEEEKQQLTSLANTVMLLVEKIAQQTEAQLAENSPVLLSVLEAGADKEGVWHVPLPEDRVEAMEQVRPQHARCAWLGTASSIPQPRPRCHSYNDGIGSHVCPLSR